MKSALQLITILFFSITLINCSSTPKGEETAANNDTPKYDDYHSSGIYDDIEGESRDVRSQEYSDDEYGDVDADNASDDADTRDDEIMLGGSDTASEPAYKQEPLPVETHEAPKKVVKKKARRGQAFKNGMYRVTVKCTMRSKPSTKAKKAGTVRKGKKLWMEKHNKDWVKVYKKSGPVYINKLCL